MQFIFKQLIPFIGKPCAYCGHEMTAYDNRRVSRDHAYPKSKGYKFTSFKGYNRIICCQVCNNNKDDRTLIQWWHILHTNKDKRAENVFKILLTWYARGFLTPRNQSNKYLAPFIKELDKYYGLMAE